MKKLARLVSSQWQWWFTLALLGVLAVRCSAPTVTPASPTPEAEKKPVIKVALDSDIDHVELMEFRSDGGYHATANLYEPLIAQQLVPGAERGVLEGTNEYGPGLAEVTFSDDKLAATVKIRPGAKFANGAPITSRSFKHTFDRAMLAPRSYVPLLVQFMGLESPADIVVVNDYTVEFRLRRPSPLFLPILSFQTLGARPRDHPRPYYPRRPVGL